MNLNYNAVLFDFDGTLVDSSEGIFKSVLYSLESFGIKETDCERLNYFIGPPLWHSFMHLYGVDEQTAEKMVEKYRERYNDIGLYESRLYDGVTVMLKALYDNGVKISVASSKPLIFIEKLLDKFEVSQYFSSVSGISFADKHAEKKNIIKKSVENMGLKMTDGILMVGDRHFDINGAVQNNIDSVGVLYGFGSKEELEQAGATYTVDKPEDIITIILA